MKIEIASELEIERLGSIVDFAKADLDVITTMEFRPIDSALGHPRKFFMAAEGCPGYPSFKFKGERIRPAAPESLWEALPASRRVEQRIPVEFEIRGAKAAGWTLLEFASKSGRRSIWGVADGAAELSFSRSIALEAANAFEGASPAECLARAQAREIENQTPNPKDQRPAPRI